MKSSINSNYAHEGRFGNLFFTGMALHFIAVKYNLKCTYKQAEIFKKLGVDFYIGGQNLHKKTIKLTDENFFQYVTDKPLVNTNITIDNSVWCQTREFAQYLREYFNQDENKSKIISSNKHSQRYNTYNDLCVHVRLGDIANREFAQPFEYYDMAISKIQFDSGYITSDSPKHPICVKLAEKYNLKVLTYDIAETIQFASTCKHIVLSSGTFSWLIGLFGYFSNVSYPNIKIRWHGDVFIFDDWDCIDY